MKKVLLLVTLLVASVTYAFSQQFIYGLNPNSGNREITANGLSSLYSITGKYTLSADGGGSTNSSYNIRISKPSAGSTVAKAYLMGLSTGFTGYQIPNSCVTLNANPITWDFGQPNGIGSYNYYADITAFIAGIMDPAAVGITNLTVGECSSSYIDGTALLVIFADPTTTEKTIVIMFGALSTTGDNFSLTLGQPIDPNVTGAILDMGLGISYSAYGPCSDQRTIIDVNSQRLTSSANGQDDGQLNNGALITVGGIGDLNTNPPDPYDFSSCDARYDDELYSLLPFITNTTTNILINTLNPSNDDNIFLSYFEISGAAIIGEGILLTETVTVENVGANHTVKALVQDDNGNPIPGKQVDFTVLAGPNAGANGSSTTNASGEAFFTYPGTGGVGFDDIQACFQNSQSQTQCSNVVTVQWIQNGPPVPVSNWAIAIGVLLIVGASVIRFKRMI